MYIFVKGGSNGSYEKTISVNVCYVDFKPSECLK